MRKNIFVVIILVLLAVRPAFADTIFWTDWTSATTGSSGSAVGSISTTGGPVTVNYTGDVIFAQTGTGTNYWTENTPAPYTGNSLVDNAPTASELIALSRSNITNTITFSKAIDDPIMAIVSLGRTALPVSYDFNVPFTVLGEGRGYWGDGTYSLLPSDILTGNELHGVIQFNGLLTSISWTASPAEYWHGFTIGVVPEPTTLFLLGFGLAGIGLLRRRFKN